jgi:cell division protein FtsB
MAGTPYRGRARVGSTRRVTPSHTSTQSTRAPKLARAGGGPRRRVSHIDSARRVAWARVGRVTMLVVLVVLVLLYVGAGRSLWSTWHESKAAQAQEASLAAQNRSLKARKASLSSNASVIAAARRLGMVKPGEQPYAVLHLPQG